MSLERASSGIAGLDEILCGGYLPGRSYLISGPPGTGKTTLGWHFLQTGAQAGERALFLSFGEAENELRENAERSGFSTEGIDVVDLSPSSDLFAQLQTYDIFSASEVEREPTTRLIVEAIGRIEPRRVFVDSMTSLRYLATDYHEFRRQALSFVRYLVGQGSVMLMTSETSADHPDDDLRFLADGVIELALDSRARTIRVTKLRGSDFRSGLHTLRLTAEGAVVFPRLVPERHVAAYPDSQLSSGLPAVDALLDGGIERGTVTLVTGPTGVGKTTLGMQFVSALAQNGHRSAVYTFDERAETLLRRCESIGIHARAMVEAGTLRVTEVEALRYGPDEFANLVRTDVEEKGTQIVMIDSVAGYQVSVAGDDLVERLHAISRYLENMGVTVLLINELQDIMSFRVSDTGLSYLADNVIFLRYIERVGNGRSELTRAIGVLKKRLSGFETTLREFRIGPTGLDVGEPMAGLFRPIMERELISDSR